MLTKVEQARKDRLIAMFRFVLSDETGQLTPTGLKIISNLKKTQ